MATQNPATTKPTQEHIAAKPIHIKSVRKSHCQDGKKNHTIITPKAIDFVCTPFNTKEVLKVSYSTVCKSQHACQYRLQCCYLHSADHLNYFASLNSEIDPTMIQGSSSLGGDGYIVPHIFDVVCTGFANNHSKLSNNVVCKSQIQCPYGLECAFYHTPAQLEYFQKQQIPKVGSDSLKIMEY